MAKLGTSYNAVYSENKSRECLRPIAIIVGFMSMLTTMYYGLSTLQSRNLVPPLPRPKMLPLPNRNSSNSSRRPYKILWYKATEIMPVVNKCSVPCKMTTNVEEIASSDAVLFENLDERPPVRPLGQPWIFYSHESPVHRQNMFRSKQWRGLFNWTFTYRLDSDIVYLYGEIKKSTYSLKLETPFHSKKLASWLVSNCNTDGKREVFVKSLRAFMPVDIYGKCGDLKCPKNVRNCADYVYDMYKFYFSFENSIFKDYVTEKMFKPFQYNIIPVVRGGANYSKFLPPGTYINTADFNSSKNLAEYLMKLGSDEEAFRSFILHKYIYSTPIIPFSEFLCKACQRIDQSEKYKRIYDRIDLWSDIR